MNATAPSLSRARVGHALALHAAACAALGRHARRPAGHRAAHGHLLGFRRAVERLSDRELAEVLRGLAEPLPPRGRR